jgi:hypothetical protein
MVRGGDTSALDAIINAWKGTTLAITAIRIQGKAEAHKAMLAQEGKYQNALTALEKRATESREKWLRQRGGFARVSDKFKTAAQMAGMPGAPGLPGGGGAGGGGAAGAVGVGRFGLTSLAGLADTMQQEAGRRLAERTANANERTAATNEAMLQLQREQAAFRESYWQGSLALHSPSIGG